MASIRRSEKLAALPDHRSRTFYFMLLAQCDAWGRADGRPAMLLADIWPLMNESVESTAEALDACSRAGLIELRSSDGKTWIQIPDWEEKAGGVGKRDHRKDSLWPHPCDSDAIGPSSGQPGPSSGHRRANAGPVRANSHTRARDPEPEPNPHPEPEPNTPAHSRGGGTELTRWWDTEWTRTRPAPFDWVRSGKAGGCPDAIALGQLQQQFPIDEIKRRITRYLNSSDLFDGKTATPRMFKSKYATLAFDIVPHKNGKPDPLEEAIRRSGGIGP